MYKENVFSLNNKVVSEMLKCEASQLNKIHKEHVNDPQGWVIKERVAHDATGYYQHDEWRFTWEYFTEVLAPKFGKKMDIPQEIKRNPPNEIETVGELTYLKDESGKNFFGLLLKESLTAKYSDGEYKQYYEPISETIRYGIEA